MKKIISAILVAVMLLSVVSIAVSAKSIFKQPDAVTTPDDDVAIGDKEEDKKPETFEPYKPATAPAKTMSGGKYVKLADAGAAELALKILLSEEETMKKPTETESEVKPKSTTSKGNTSTQKEKKANGGTKNETKASAANTPSNEKSNATSEKKVVKKRPEKRLKEKETVSKTPKESPTKAPTPTNRSKDNKKQTVLNKNTTPKSENNPTESQAKTTLNLTRLTTKLQNAPTSSAAKLKNHATKSKVATPTFKDLGESREGGKTVYRVECIFMGKSTIGVGASRPEAKEDAAGRILSSITSQGEKKQKNESGTKAKRPKRK